MSYWFRMAGAAVLYAIYFRATEGIPMWRQLAGAALATSAGALLAVSP